MIDSLSILHLAEVLWFVSGPNEFPVKGRIIRMERVFTLSSWLKPTAIGRAITTNGKGKASQGFASQENGSLLIVLQNRKEQSNEIVFVPGRNSITQFLFRLLSRVNCLFVLNMDALPNVYYLITMIITRRFFSICADQAK